MKSWTPLWNTIVTSTLWGETKEVRILFVTMLALKDSDGKVHGTLSGLKRLANLDTIEECAEAMRILESPDRHSETCQDYEGRRVIRIDGGWQILNWEKYRDMISSLRTAERRRVNQQNYRDREKAKKEASENNGDGYTDLDALSAGRGITSETPTEARVRMEAKELERIRDQEAAKPVIWPPPKTDTL